MHADMRSNRKRAIAKRSAEQRRRDEERERQRRELAMHRWQVITHEVRSPSVVWSFTNDIDEKQFCCLRTSRFAIELRSVSARLHLTSMVDDNPILRAIRWLNARSPHLYDTAWLVPPAAETSAGQEFRDMGLEVDEKDRVPTAVVQQILSALSMHQVRIITHELLLHNRGLLMKTRNYG